MADKVDAEVTRIREMLVQALEVNRYSIRFVERKLGATVGAKRKVLRGQSPLTVRHVLEILDAIGLPWETFFHALYPPSGARPAQVRMEPGLGAPEPGKTGREARQEAGTAPPAGEEGEDQRAERILRQALAKVLDEVLKGGKD